MPSEVFVLAEDRLPDLRGDGVEGTGVLFRRSCMLYRSTNMDGGRGDSRGVEKY
jgi:hypothetical protein